MVSQFTLFHGGTFQMRDSEPLRMDVQAGELAVLAGQVWLTRSGDPVDHVMRPGERLHIEPREQVVVQAWERSDWPTLRWNPDPADRPAGQRVGRGLRREALAAGWAGLAALSDAAAAGLRRAEAGFAALARSAASSASRAQGCA